MSRHTIDGDGRTARVKVFVAADTEVAAVYGIRKISTESFHIEVVLAGADFFVRCEGEGNLSVRNVRILNEVFQCTDDFHDAGLIVTAQQCIAVGYDDVLAHAFCQVRILRRIDGHAAFQCNNAAVVVFDDFGQLGRSRQVICSIHMGQETDGRYFLLHVGRQAAIYIAHFVHPHVFHADGLDVFYQMLGKIDLARGTWHSISMFRCSGVPHHII